MKENDSRCRLKPGILRSLHGMKVSVVGLIRRAEPTLTHLVYSLDDMTGPLLPVKQWLNLEVQIPVQSLHIL